MNVTEQTLSCPAASGIYKYLFPSITPFNISNADFHDIKNNKKSKINSKEIHLTIA